MYARLRGKLTEDSKKAVRREVEREVADQIERLNHSILVRLAYSLHTGHEKMGQKRLERTLAEFGTQLKKLNDRYKLGTDDEEWLCRRKLEDDGIDIETILNEAGVAVKWEWK